MGNLSKELSSWRKQIVTCKSGIITTIDFMDTRPNIMFIMNPTEATLLASIDHSPTPKNYDFKIKGHYTRLIGKPTRTRQCYIYNDSNIDCDVQVYSLYDEKFDPSWIKDFNIENVNISNETLEAIKEMITGNVVIDGVKDGVVLPVTNEYFSEMERHLTLIQNYVKNVSTLSAQTEIIQKLEELRDVYENFLVADFQMKRATSIYESLKTTTEFSKEMPANTATLVNFIVGNGTLQFSDGNNIQTIPINGFMRDITYHSTSTYTIKYIKPVDELENAYILYKKFK